jgi:hypothetical protein
MEQLRNSSTPFKVVLSLVLAVITASGGWLAAYYNYQAQLSHQRAEIEVAALEMGKVQKNLSFGEYLADWDETELMIADLIDSTNISRFLLMKAWNGSVDPKWSTATFQIRESNQKVFNYVHVDLDADYVNRLREIMINEYAVLYTDNLPNSLIKSIYMNENVGSALWAMIGQREEPGGHVVHTYVSFATQNGDILDENTITQARLVVSRIKANAAEYRRVHGYSPYSD